jgi:predicted ATPase/DNA-binding winged helix-turn-helix (wHTH) protein
VDRGGSSVTVDTLYRFGTHCLIPRQRLLLSGNEPVHIGGRAFAILVALVERAGGVVSAQELLRIAWPGVVVEEANLRVQIGTLRKLLENKAAKGRVIETVPLQGYCFVAPVERIAGEAAERPAIEAIRHNLPAEPTSTVGRDETIETLVEVIGRRRLVTITGPGGIGKTTVALAVVRKCMAGFPDGVRFVDLSPITDARLVPTALASALDMAVLSEEPVAGLIAHLSGKRLMLVLDTCEHLIEAVTLLTERLLAGAPYIRIVATSRETLRASGEWVHRLQPLAVPPDVPSLPADDVLSYPAVELFVQRVAAYVDGFGLRDCDAALASSICRQLDGIPLAIEFAAAHVDEMGLREVATRLSDRLAILIGGRRTALPRHQTLLATLEWSYDLLSAQERTVLRHLSVFRGSFTAEAACTVAAYDMEKRQAYAVLSNLHAKSLVTAEIGSEVVLYRLLDTTRCFAAEKEMSAGDWEATQGRHARFVLETMRCAEREWETEEATAWTTRYGYLIEDVRGALEWAFSSVGDRKLAVALTAASSPLWFALSLLQEHRHHVECSLAGVDAGVSAEPSSVIRLWDALGHTLWHAHGDLPAMEKAFSHVLEIADREQRPDDKLRALWGRLVLANMNGNYGESVATLERYGELTAAVDNPKTHMTYQRMAALAWHFAGDHSRASEHAEYILSHATSRARGARQNGLQLDQRITARSVLARTLWVRGYAEQAARHASEGLWLSQATGHALSECFVLANAVIPIAFWTGDLATAETMTSLLLLRSREHGFGFWNAFGAGYADILKRRSDPSAQPSHCSQVGINPSETLAICDAGCADGQLLDRAARGVVGWCTPELLRIRAARALVDGEACASAKSALLEASRLAGKQGALALELRIASSLADLLLRESRHEEARVMLLTVLSRFSEGFATSDLVFAGEKLASLEKQVRTCESLHIVR